MTSIDKIRLALLLVKYLATNPLSHIKRNLLHEILGGLLEDCIQQLIPPSPDAGDIPF